MYSATNTGLETRIHSAGTSNYRLTESIAHTPQNFGYSGNCGYLGGFGLENHIAAAQNFLIELPGYEKENQGYSKCASNYENTKEYTNNITHRLLKKNRPLVQFIREAEEIKELVEETFEKTTGQKLPTDIVVHVLSEEDLKKAHRNFGGNWNAGIMGFAINEERLIFAKNNDLDALMLTVGHEIGHVLTSRLPNPIDEEAKAFAFERAWAEAIIQNDIGGLSDNFNPGFMPAENGLHDRAFGMVQRIVRTGKKAIEVFWEISKGLTAKD